MDTDCLIRHKKPWKDSCSKLKLRGVFGRRVFTINLKNESGVTTADLAKDIECQTGVPPMKQTLTFKGIALSPPDVGEWAPRLDQLHLRDGDKVLIIAALDQIYPDNKSVEELERVKPRVIKLDKEVTGLMTRSDMMLRGCQGMGRGSAVVQMTRLRQAFEHLKTRLRDQTEVLNSLKFDHRNYICQARRRELVDHLQRQIDKCADMAEGIFQRLAISHCYSNVGRIYPTERLPPIGRAPRTH